MKRAPMWLALLLSGCVSFTQPAPEIHDYRLDYASPSVTGSQLPVVLSIPRLRVGAVYDRELVVYREGQYSTGTYFYNRWSANPGSMIADLLVRDFIASNLYRAVQPGPSPLPADDQLRGEIEEIEERVASTGCSAHLKLRVLLVRLSGATADPVLVQKNYTEDEASTCYDMNALATSMSRALQRISEQVQHDVYDAIAADIAKR